MEQVTGIEPAYSAWEADTLPLSYTCMRYSTIIIQNASDVKHLDAFCIKIFSDFFDLLLIFSTFSVPFPPFLPECSQTIAATVPR